jgi:hypothetical protein
MSASKHPLKDTTVPWRRSLHGLIRVIASHTQYCALDS